MKKTIFENNKIIFELEDGILLGNWKCDIIDLDVAKEVVKHRVEATEGKKYPLLVDIKNVKTSTKEARDFLASEKGCEGLVASGILIGSSIGSMIGNFFINISRPYIPTQLFSDEAKAKKWLKSQIK